MASFRILVILAFLLSIGQIKGGVTNRLQIQTYAGITLEADIGSRLRIEYSPDADAPTGWTLLNEIVLDHSPFLFIDISTPANAKRFYRSVKLGPAPSSATELQGKTFTLDNGLVLHFQSVEGNGGIYFAIGTRSVEMGTFVYARNSDGNAATIVTTTGTVNAVQTSYILNFATSADRLKGIRHRNRV
jgi:hypothetical protein